MFHSIIKEFDSGKCTKLIITKKGFWGLTFYEIKLFTTKPKTKVPSLEQIKKIHKPILDKFWVLESNEGYTHKVTLKEYPNLKIRIKQIDQPKKIEENETD